MPESVRLKRGAGRGCSTPATVTPADRLERAGERDVVDVVPGRAGERSRLTEAGHAPVDEPRVAREADVGPEAEALHHAGPEPLEQPIGALHEPQHRRDRFGVLQVDGDAAPAAREQITRSSAGCDARESLDAQHFGAHVGEHQRAERARADAADLHDAHSRERTHPVRGYERSWHDRKRRTNRMALPTGIGVIDLMLAIPTDDTSRWYDFMKPLLRDQESREQFKMPAQYMFRNIPGFAPGADFLKLVVAEMDKYGIERAMIGVDSGNESAQRALKEHPERFFASYEVNPNEGMDEVRKIVALRDRFGLKALTAFPSGLCPQVPINDKKFYPIYAKCVELDIPICVCSGVPGPRLPMAPQNVELIDEVCWFFPELKFVMRHGAEPWTALAVKLMLKWPNLYYSTSAFAPKHYPKDIIDFANTRGADKIMYAGYFPMGLSLERIFGDLPQVPFRDAVWPKFLRENAIRVFKL